MERFQAPSFCPGCGKPPSSWLPACRSCGTRFADACVVCRRAIAVGAVVCADHRDTPLPEPPAGIPSSPLAAIASMAAAGAWPTPTSGSQGASFPPPPPPEAAAGLRGARRIAAVMVGMVAFMVTAAGVGAVFIGRNADAAARVREYVEGTGDKEFFASDLQFRAMFPTVPSRSTDTVDIGGEPQPVVLYTSDLGPAGFSAGAMDLPAGSEFDLNLAVNGAAAGTGGRIEAASLTTFQGYPAAEFLLAVDDGLYVQGLIVHTPSRLYHLQAVGETNPPGGYDHFKASFNIALP